MYELQKNDIYNSESSNVTLVECTKKKNGAGNEHNRSIFKF